MLCFADKCRLKGEYLCKEKDIGSEEAISESDEFDYILEDPDWNIDNIDFTNKSIDDDDYERLDDEEEFYDDIYDESDD